MGWRSQSIPVSSIVRPLKYECAGSEPFVKHNYDCNSLKNQSVEFRTNRPCKVRNSRAYKQPKMFMVGTEPWTTGPKEKSFAMHRVWYKSDNFDGNIFRSARLCTWLQINALKCLNGRFFCSGMSPTVIVATSTALFWILWATLSCPAYASATGRPSTESSLQACEYSMYQFPCMHP